MPRVQIVTVVGVLLITGVVQAQNSFVNFETPPLHPLEMTPDGSKLLLANTADAKLEIFSLASGTPVWSASIPVGLDPVTVRARSNTEAWVVNHISDSISVVDLSSLNVVGTIATGDEPWDVVFAGSPQKAFVSVAGLNQVRVYDPLNRSAPPTIVPIAGHQPRALAADSSRVYAAIFFAGNRSTVLPASVVSDPNSPYAGQNPPPNSGTNFSPPIAAGLPTPPPVGLIVNLETTPNGEKWKDDNQHLWDANVTWMLNQNAVAIINNSTLAVSYAKNIGNIQKAISVQPVSGRVTVVQTYLRNEARFETTARAQFARNRLAVFDPLGVQAGGILDVNPHLFANPPIPIYKTSVTPAERAMSIGDMRAIVWKADGMSAWISGMDSNNVIRVSIGTSGAPNLVRQATIDVGQGPTGLALDAARSRLYCLNHFDGTISIINTTTNAEILPRVPFFDPTPVVIRNGRPFLYDAHNNSALGQASCASCHLDGKTDMQSWDLGNPSGSMKTFDESCNGGLPVSGTCGDFHPMKGPMLTQVLQGIVGNGPMHRRGDRPDLLAFNVGFTGLLGNASAPTPSQMQQLSDFIATIQFPPQPNRTMTDGLPASLSGFPGVPANGAAIFSGPPVAGSVGCSICHSNLSGGNPSIVSGNNFGDAQGFKVPHLRSLYTQSGFNKMSQSGNRGFGYGHDGAADSVANFLTNHVGAFPAGQTGTDMRNDLEAFLMCFPSGTHPAVGAQLTFDGTNNSDASAIGQLNTMMGLADNGVVGLIAKGRVGGLQRGYAYCTGSGTFQSDRATELVPADTLRLGAAAGAEITITVVPVVERIRLGVDRDEDGVFDRDELDGGTDPKDPASAAFPRGDMNLDHIVDLIDLPIFATVLVDPDDATLGQLTQADVNGDGHADGLDVQAILTLVQAHCP
jgi:YVTN family beta-propeller protein